MVHCIVEIHEQASDGVVNEALFAAELTLFNSHTTSKKHRKTFQTCSEAQSQQMPKENP